MLKDQWLILRFRHGSREAFCRIYETYRDDLLRVAMSLLQEKSVAEDIVHEVFVRLIQTRRTFRLTGSLKAYLAACVANRARNTNRDNHHHRMADAEEAFCRIATTRRPDQWAMCSEQFDRLRAALMTLPYAQREVVALHIQGQLTFREIAELLNCSIKTVQSRYRYALDKLRVLLNSEVQV